MKKTFLILFSIFFSIQSTRAQEGSFSRGNVLVNLGLGLNSYYSGGIPLGASVEVGVGDQFSIGGNIDYFSYSYNSYPYNYKFSIMYLAARGSYHFNEVLNISNDKIDFYGGATLGYRIFSWNDNYSGTSISGTYGSGLFLGGYIGGKYYFNEKLGVFTELGAIGSTNARIGLGLKL